MIECSPWQWADDEDSSQNYSSSCHYQLCRIHQVCWLVIQDVTLDGVQILTREAAILKRKVAGPGHVQQSDSAGDRTGMVQMRCQLGCTRWLHIGAKCWIRLNCSCAASNYFDHLLQLPLPASTSSFTTMTDRLFIIFCYELLLLHPFNGLFPGQPG